MPSDWERLHGFSVVSRALLLARQLLLPAILGGASAGDNVATAVQWIAVILVVPSIAIAFGQWLAFRFRLDDDELVIQSGVLSRRRRVIPIGRVQNVDLEQSALERLAGVAQLRIETASGGGQTEAGLSVLRVARARGLRSDLLRRRDGAAARPYAPEGAVAGTGAGPDGARPVLRLSAADLAIAGATSNEAGLLAAGLATGIELADNLGGMDRVAGWVEDAMARGAGLGVLGFLVAGTALAVAVLIVGWLLSVLVTVVRYHGYTLTRSDGELRREYGLLSRHHSTVPLERVQAVRIEETLLRRPLGLVALKIDTAGSGPSQARQRRSDAFVPIARRKAVGPLLREVFPDARFEDVALHAVSPLAQRRTFLRLAGLVLAVTAVAGLVTGLDGLAFALLLGPAWLYARADYRARGWGRSERYALVRRGVLTRTSWVVPERKIQTLHLSETPFQRRLDLASLIVDTAGIRPARVGDLGRGTALELLGGLAADAEAARRSDLRAAARAAR